jgi:hypothetical protein
MAFLYAGAVSLRSRYLVDCWSEYCGPKIVIYVVLFPISICSSNQSPLQSSQAMRSTFILLFAIVNAGVVPVDNGRYALPGYLFARQVPESSTPAVIPVIMVTETPNPTVTDAPTAALLDNAFRVASTCTPVTTCVDGLACSWRWGG